MPQSNVALYIAQMICISLTRINGNEDPGSVIHSTPAKDSRPVCVKDSKFELIGSCFTTDFSV